MEGRCADFIRKQQATGADVVTGTRYGGGKGGVHGKKPLARSTWIVLRQYLAISQLKTCSQLVVRTNTPGVSFSVDPRLLMCAGSTLFRRDFVDTFAQRPSECQRVNHSSGATPVRVA
jgi:hypothetical protein